LGWLNVVAERVLSGLLQVGLKSQARPSLHGLAQQAPATPTHPASQHPIPEFLHGTLISRVFCRGQNRFYSLPLRRLLINISLYYGEILTPVKNLSPKSLKRLPGSLKRGFSEKIRNQSDIPSLFLQLPLLRKKVMAGGYEPIQFHFELSPEGKGIQGIRAIASIMSA
jgi:hypothetical protein